MMNGYEPLAHPASLPELVSAWGARYHYLYKLTRVMKLHPTRGDKNALILDIPQQQQLADVLNNRTPRPKDLEQLSAEELHGELDRLARSYERLAEAYDVLAGLTEAYRRDLDGRDAQATLTQSPDTPQALRVLEVLNHPAEASLADVQEAALVTAAVAGIFSRRYEGDQAAYDRLVEAMAGQPLGMLRGELIGSLFTLGALIEAALSVHRVREGEASAEVLTLERTLTAVLCQVKRWGNDALPWLGERIRPLAADIDQVADASTGPARH